MLKIYVYKNCDACRRALRWLEARPLPFAQHPIRDTPPSLAELAAMLRLLGGARRRLCNTSGTDYRSSGLGAEIDTLSEKDFLARLAANGNLVKRPFLLRAPGPDQTELGLVGFAEDAWAAALER
jgi:arsenate reductase (glutaredoxin)